MLNSISVKVIGGTLPVKSSGDAGYDLFACEDTVIPAGRVGLIPLGIQTSFESHLVGIIKDRSSWAVRGLLTCAGVIDSSYRGEWKVVMLNTTDVPVTIARGDKCAQVIFTMCANGPMVEMQQLPQSHRGAGGFGSTGQ